MTRPAWLVGVRSILRPTERLSLAEWAARHFVLSPESSASPGRFHPYAYQVGILDAFTDPAVEWITWMKSARLGATKILGAAIGYFIDHEPSSILIVQPTLLDARGWSKEELAPMLRDIAVLSDIVGEPHERSPDQTILQRMYPGGVLSIVGANSAAGFRRITRRVALLDEVDGYPPSAGIEGDPVDLAVKRTETFWNRKIATVSTPTIAGVSKIEPLFESGDQRRFHVPCPHCGVFDFLVFRPRDDRRGHVMRWPKDEPERAFFECSACGRQIDHRHKRDMVEAGHWQADAEFRGHASFHLWAAYSFSPNATWGDIAERYSKAARSGNTEKLKTVVNTDLGETWKEKGEAPAWESLFRRREPRALGVVPAGVRFLTAGVDVQRDRLVAEVTGWNERKESWLIDIRVLYGDTSADATWLQLDALLAEQFPREGKPDERLSIASMGVDSGFNTQVVYNWCRRYPPPRVIATKGVSSVRTLVGAPSLVDVNFQGRRVQNGYRVFPIGVDLAKDEFYGWLRLTEPTDPAVGYPPGWCHFPEVDEGYFRQITAEQKVPVKTRQGFTVWIWRIIENRENHHLDTRVIARAAASVLGLDRLVVAPPAGAASPTATSSRPPAPAVPPPSPFTRPGRSPFAARPRAPSPFGRRR